MMLCHGMEMVPRLSKTNSARSGRFYHTGKVLSMDYMTVVSRPASESTLQRVGHQLVNHLDNSNLLNY